MQTAMRRIGNLQSVTVMLESEEAYEIFENALANDPVLSVDVIDELEYYSQQSETVNNLLNIVAYFVGGIMAVGAVFAALNTMYTTVSMRSIEIATLRALGFGSSPIVISVIVEAMLLAFIGGLIGAFMAWLFFNGNVVTTASGGFSSRIISLNVSLELAATGITWACAIGFVGGVLPAIRAARLPVAIALRQF